ncbi:hypothetical protein LTR08_004186 [Meristemomyces frigidus]|nr:hypothetical protein LTR08_004186 [Meristemomyces frigidus]
MPSSLSFPHLTSTPIFTVQTHRFPGQHLRQYPGATRHREEAILYLEAKQYRPLSNPDPQDGDVTILATHATGFPKELYEPFFARLLQHSARAGFRIRSIWIADASNQNASGVINEGEQGDDPSSLDYPRDLLHMINIFRAEFPAPIVGVGHSMGATALTHLAHLHPRLLAALVLFDPIMDGAVATDYATMFYQNALRPDLWSSREAAERGSRALWRKWDPEVLALWMEFGLRDTPTLAHPQAGKVTLRTAKAQEGWLYSRNCFDPLPADGEFATTASRIKYPDLHPGIQQTHPFYRPEDPQMWRDLAHLRPSVLYVCPADGPGAVGASTAAKLAQTGVGQGGSGGVKAGRVSAVVVEGAGHLLVFERPGECAAVAARWVGEELGGWRERGVVEKGGIDDKSVGQVALSAEWMRLAGVWFAKVRAGRGGGQAKL